MNRTRTTLLLTVAVFALVALALPAAASSPRGTMASNMPRHHASHALEVKGTITALDEKADDMKVKDTANKETEIFWTADTHVAGILKVGEPVTARYLAKNGKNMATSIRAGAQPTAVKSTK